MTDQSQTTMDPSTTESAKAAVAETASEASVQAKAVAGTAAEQAKEVAGQAKAQAANVADEARVQAQRLLSTTGTEVTGQLDQRLGEVTGTARTTAGELRALAEGRHEDAGRAGDLVHEASVRLDQLADRVDELGVRGVVDEVSEFARRRPVAFLFGAAVAGVLVGRLAKAGTQVSANTESSPSVGVPRVGPLAASAPAPVIHPSTVDPAAFDVVDDGFPAPTSARSSVPSEVR